MMRVLFENPGRFGMAGLSGCLLVLAHLATTIIQRDPWRFREILETRMPWALCDPWVYPVLVAAGITLWAICSWFHSLGSILPAAYRKLEAALGRPGAVLFLAVSLLPQRVMDDNSGYVFLSSDNPVWWLVYEMDWARALFAFDLLVRLVGLESPASTGPAGEVKRALSPAVLAVLSLFSLFVPVCIGQVALGGVPHVQDEIIQEWHVRLLEAGRITSPDMEVRSSFQAMGIGNNGRSLFSTYQPAFAYLLFLARRVGAGAFLNPLLGLAAFWLLFLVVRRTHGEDTARTLVVLGLLSPFVLLMQAGLMNHLLMLFLLVVGAFSLDAADRGRVGEAAVLGGLALGLSWMTRRVDAIALHLAWVAGWYLLTALSGRRIFWSLVALAISACAFTMNMRLAALSAGDSLHIIRQGQVVMKGLGGFDPFRLFANLSDNLCGFGVFAFGGVLAGFAGIALLRPFRREPAGQVERFLLINAVLVILGYSVYDYQDLCYGPRYFFPILLPALLGIAILLTRLREGGLREQARRLVFVSTVMSLLLTAGQSWAVLGNEFWHINPELSRFVEGQGERPRILFVTSPTRQRLELARYLQGTWKFSGEELMALLAGDFIDTVGMRRFLDRARPASKKECLKYIESYQSASGFRRPELHAISIYEVPRINSVEPLAQRVVLAIDRGDLRNDALMKALPGHEPLLLGRTPEGYFVEPYRRAGVDEFGDLLVP